MAISGKAAQFSSVHDDAVVTCMMMLATLGHMT